MFKPEKLSPAPSRQIWPLQIGQIAEVTTTAFDVARVCTMRNSGDQPAAPWTNIDASSSAKFGPYPGVRFLAIEAVAGQPTIANVDADPA
jgi:hypothetical protein